MVINCRYGVAGSAYVFALNLSMSWIPSTAPSGIPSGEPSALPSGAPSSKPSSVPTSKPSTSAPTNPKVLNEFKLIAADGAAAAQMGYAVAAYEGTLVAGAAGDSATRGTGLWYVFYIDCITWCARCGLCLFGQRYCGMESAA